MDFVCYYCMCWAGLFQHNVHHGSILCSQLRSYHLHYYLTITITHNHYSTKFRQTRPRTRGRSTSWSSYYKKNAYFILFFMLWCCEDIFQSFFSHFCHIFHLYTSCSSLQRGSKHNARSSCRFCVCGENKVRLQLDKPVYYCV